MDVKRWDSTREPQLSLQPPRTGFCSPDHCRHVLHHETNPSRSTFSVPLAVTGVMHQPWTPTQSTRTIILKGCITTSLPPPHPHQCDGHSARRAEPDPACPPELDEAHGFCPRPSAGGRRRHLVPFVPVSRRHQGAADF